MHSSSIGAKGASRVAARLQFLEEDPLDFWDFGMIFAFDVIAERLQELAGVNQMVAVNGVLKLLTEEREVVLSRELHTLLTGTGKPANPSRIAWAARLAAVRSATKRCREAAQKSVRQARASG